MRCQSSKSPLGRRIELLTAKVQDALRQTPSALKRKKDKSACKPKLLNRNDNSKSTVDIGTQNTERHKPQMEGIVKLKFAHLKTRSRIDTQVMENQQQGKAEGQDVNRSQKFGQLSFRSYNKKIKQLDVSHFGSQLTIPVSSISPINYMTKSPRSCNFRSLSNLDLSNRFQNVLSTNSKLTQVSPVRVDLDLVQVVEYGGWQPQPKLPQPVCRIVLGEQIKHKMAMRIRQKLFQNKTNGTPLPKRMHQTSSANLRDTLIKRINTITSTVT